MSRLIRSKENLNDAVDRANLLNLELVAYLKREIPKVNSDYSDKEIGLFKNTGIMSSDRYFHLPPYIFTPFDKLAYKRYIQHMTDTEKVPVKAKGNILGIIPVTIKGTYEKERHYDVIREDGSFSIGIPEYREDPQWRDLEGYRIEELARVYYDFNRTYKSYECLELKIVPDVKNGLGWPCGFESDSIQRILMLYGEQGYEFVNGHYENYFRHLNSPKEAVEALECGPLSMIVRDHDSWA